MLPSSQNQNTTDYYEMENSIEVSVHDCLLQMRFLIKKFRVASTRISEKAFILHSLKFCLLFELFANVIYMSVVKTTDALDCGIP